MSGGHSHKAVPGSFGKVPGWSFAKFGRLRTPKPKPFAKLAKPRTIRNSLVLPPSHPSAGAVVLVHVACRECGHKAARVMSYPSVENLVFVVPSRGTRWLLPAAECPCHGFPADEGLFRALVLRGCAEAKRRGAPSKVYVEFRQPR